MDEASLVSAALDAPDDLGPRLVYADFLLEQDDPRGELIAVQCALLDPQATHPRWALASARRAAVVSPDASRSSLLARERALREAHEEAWLARYGLEPDDGTFQCGLLALTLSAERLCEVAPRFGSSLPAFSLRLAQIHPGLNKALGCLHRLVGLSSLHLDNLALDLVSIQTLARSVMPPRMAALHLARNSLGPLGARTLASSPHLGGLSRLYLGHNQLGPTGALALAESPLAALGVLDVEANQLGAEGLLALLLSSRLPCLDALHLRANRLGEAGARAIAESLRLAQLRVLNLGFNDLGDAGALALAQSPHAASLTALDLAYNRITDKGALALAESPHLGSLVSLQIGANKLSPRAGKALEARFGAGVLL